MRSTRDPTLPEQLLWRRNDRAVEVLPMVDRAHHALRTTAAGPPGVLQFSAAENIPEIFYADRPGPVVAGCFDCRLLDFFSAEHKQPLCFALVRALQLNRSPD